MNAFKKVILSAMILFLGSVAIHAAEDKEWLREGSLNERTENWAQSSSLRSTQEDNTPPGEPWGAPIGNGAWCILAATGLYVLVKTHKRNINRFL